MSLEGKTTGSTGGRLRANTGSSEEEEETGSSGEEEEEGMWATLGSTTGGEDRATLGSSRERKWATTGSTVGEDEEGGE